MKELMNKINQFRDDRDWRKFHNEKDLAISISLEASELLELFQWKKSEEVVASSLKEIKEELADVLIYSLSCPINRTLLSFRLTGFFKWFFIRFLHSSSDQYKLRIYPYTKYIILDNL